MTKVFRKQYMMKLKKDSYNEGDFNDTFRNRLNALESEVQEAIQNKKLTTLSLYHYKETLFIYCESARTEFSIQDWVEGTKDCCVPYPTLLGQNYCIQMNPYFYHSVPEDEEDWRRVAKPTDRIGRIALLKEDKYTSYLYHHLGIIREGLLTGDQYHLISMYDRLLFSYYEEPKTITNINKSYEPCKTLQGWMDVDPESHFECFDETQKSNFLVLPKLLSY